MKLERDNAVLQWSGGYHLKSYSPMCLQHFLTLAASDQPPTPKKVEAFAKKWGPLVKPEEERLSDRGGLTFIRETVVVQGANGSTHLTNEELEAAEDAALKEHAAREICQEERDARTKAEPLVSVARLTVWTRLAQEMSAMIGLTRYVHNRDPSAHDQEEARRQWSLLAGGSSRFPLEVTGTERDERIKHFVSDMASSLLQEVQSGIVVKWDAAFPRVKLLVPSARASSLYAALVWQLVAVVSNPERTFVCFFCRRPSFKQGKERRARKGLPDKCVDPDCEKKRKRINALNSKNSSSS